MPKPRTHPRVNSTRAKKYGIGGGLVEDDAFGAGWDADTTHAPSQNAVYDVFNDHSGRHESAGGDPIKLDDLASPEDNTDLDFSTSAHGLVPKGTNAGDFLKDDATWATPAGAGDVTGPGSATDNAIARFDGASGKTIQDYTSNPPTISDTGDITVDGDLTTDNIITAGDVDGRDVSTDGTKLDGVEAGATADQVASEVEVEELATATYDDVQDYINFFGQRTVISGGTISDNGDGTATVAAGTAWCKVTDSDTAVGVFFDFSADAAVAIADLITDYLYVDYNGGTPQIVAGTDILTFGLMQDHAFIGTVFRDGNKLRWHQAQSHIGGIAKHHVHNIEQFGVNRVSGMVTSSTGTRNLVVTAGVAYHGVSRQASLPFDTSRAGTADATEAFKLHDADSDFVATDVGKEVHNTTDDTYAFVTAFVDSGELTLDADIFVSGEAYNIDQWTYWYYDGDLGPAAWVEVHGATQIDNTQYNALATGLATLTANRYGVHWVYQEFDGEHLHFVYGQGDYTLSLAEAAALPSSLPNVITHYCILLAKIVVQKSSDTLTVELPWVTTFTASGATDHGSLGGLGDDDHAQYVKDSEFAAAEDVLVGTGAGTFSPVTLSAQKVLGMLTGGNTAAITIGIADNNMVQVDGTPVDTEVAVWTAAGLDSKSEAEFKALVNLEIGTDVLAEQTIGIADDNLVEVDGSPADDEYAKWTAAGLEGRSYAEVLADLSAQAGAAFDWNGQDLANIGVTFLTEQAAAEADVAGKGQFWVKTATPNEPWFTNDAGFDIALFGKTVANTTYYVDDSTGNDANPGTSGSPFATPQGAVDYLKAYSPYIIHDIVIAVNNSGTYNVTSALDLAGLYISGTLQFKAMDLSDNELYVSGTASAGDATTITGPAGTSYATNEWAGCEIFIWQGTGVGQHRTIISNTNADPCVYTISSGATDWTTNPDATSDFVIAGTKIDGGGNAINFAAPSAIDNIRFYGFWFNNFDGYALVNTGGINHYLEQCLVTNASGEGLKAELGGSIKQNLTLIETDRFALLVDTGGYIRSYRSCLQESGAAQGHSGVYVRGGGYVEFNATASKENTIKDWATGVDVADNSFVRYGTTQTYNNNTLDHTAGLGTDNSYIS